MNKMLVVARHEFLVTVRRRGFVIFTALMPTIGLVGMIGFLVIQTVTGDNELATTRVGYVDQTGLFTSFRTQGVAVLQPFPDRTAGTDALLSGSIDALYVVSPDYLETGEVIEVRERWAGIMPDEASREALDRLLRDNLLSGYLPPDRLARVLDPVKLTSFEIDDVGELTEEQVGTERFVFFFTVAVLIMMSVMFTSGYLLRGLSEEKESRIIEILLSSVTSDQLILGKLLGLGGAGLFQVTVWIFSGTLIFLILQIASKQVHSVGLPGPTLLIVALLYFVLGYALTATMLGAMGAVTSSLREAQPLTFIVVMPAVLPFWLTSVILEDPNRLFVRILSFIPITAPTTSLVRLALDSMGPFDLVISLALLFAGVALTVVLAMRIFRAYLLMYGQRPDLREISRTLARG